MANTLSLMTNVIRNAVSKQRIRYTENGFNLDLAYICHNIIAMGYPANNYEGIYRNRIDDVYQFFEGHHKDHYKIYNLCSERSYDINKFHGRVAIYPFDDHNPPTIELIQEFCDDVDRWLKADKKNVAAVHCKAGKGRTGTMICCYLLHSGFTDTADDALAFYDEKRTKDRKGVTIPSQRRYVEYYSRLLKSGKEYERRPLQMCEIKFSSIFPIHNQDTVHCSISSLPDPSSAEKTKHIHTSVIDFRKSQSIEFKDCCIILTGDVKIEVFHKLIRKKEKDFHFWFNTHFLYEETDCKSEVDDVKIVREFLKQELDDAHKDRDCRIFPEDFKVEIVLKPVPRGYLNENETTLQNNVFRNENQIHRYNDQLPNYYIKNSVNPQTTATIKGPIYEATGGSLASPTSFPENNKIETQHHQNNDCKRNLQSQQNHPNNARKDYNDVMSVSDRDAQYRGNSQLQQTRDKPSNVHNHHTPSVSPDVSRTNSSSSSSISSEASSAAGEDWESGEFKHKCTNMMMMTDGRNKTFNNSSSLSNVLMLSDIRLINNNNLSSSIGSNKIVNASNSSCSTTSSKLISIAVRPATQKFKAKTSNIKTPGHNKISTRKGFKKLHWLNKLKSEPALCETLVKPVSFVNKQSNDVISIQQPVRSLKPSFVKKQIIDANSDQQKANIVTDHDDYYSSLCDRQLSFGTSPCKSPRSIVSPPPPSVDKTNKKGNSDSSTQLFSGKVVIAKPIDCHSIGFNVTSTKKANAPPDMTTALHICNEESIASEKQPVIARDAVNASKCAYATESTQTNLSVNNEQKNNCDTLQSIMMLSSITSSSPPARLGNRCAPFSFRGIKQELQSVMKQNTNKKTNRSNSTTSNSINRLSLNTKKNSLPDTSSSSRSLTEEDAIILHNQKF